MALSIDAFNKLVLVTSPTTDVDAQTLHDFVEDYMASPLGLLTDGAWERPGDILLPEGKIEDPSNPGVFSQIILILNPEWQIQFWGGSGYTRIFGGKIVGGVSDQPLKATGTAGDISVLESPVDGVTVAVGSGVTQQDKDDIEEQVHTRVMEDGETFEQSQRLQRAAAAGAVEQLADGTYKIKSKDGLKDRIEGDDAANSGRDITGTDSS